MDERDTPQPSDFERFSVYSGRQHLGEIFNRARRVTAELVDGTDLGAFPNSQAVAEAIIRASSGKGRAK